MEKGIRGTRLSRCLSVAFFFPRAALHRNPRTRPGHKPAKPPTPAQESEAVALCPSSLTPL